MSMTLCNGAVLPDISADILTDYPYACIMSISSESDTTYMLMVLTEETILIPKDVSSAENDMWYQANPCNSITYTAVDSNWVQDGMNTSAKAECPIGTMNGETYTLLWSNHDVYIATAFDKTTGETTVGTEIYFVEYKELNGVWFPKIPKDFENSYPYEIIVKIEVVYTDEHKESYPNVSDELMYALLLGPTEFVYSYDSMEEMYIVHSKKFLGNYGYIVYGTEDLLINKWLDPSESLNDTDDYFPIISISTAAYTVTYSLHWSNHDIHVCTVADDGTLTETEEVYMSGTGVVEPPEYYIIDRKSLAYGARKARKLTGVIAPMDADEIISAFAGIEAFEDAEGMVF